MSFQVSEVRYQPITTCPQITSKMGPVHLGPVSRLADAALVCQTLWKNKRWWLINPAVRQHHVGSERNERGTFGDKCVSNKCEDAVSQGRAYFSTFPSPWTRLLVWISQSALLLLLLRCSAAVIFAINTNINGLRCCGRRKKKRQMGEITDRCVSLWTERPPLLPLLRNLGL